MEFELKKKKEKIKIQILSSCELQDLKLIRQPYYEVKGDILSYFPKECEFLSVHQMGNSRFFVQILICNTSAHCITC